MMVPIWRRKYLLFSGCAVWAIFYLYLHYVHVPEDLPFTADGISVKHPVDITLLHETSLKSTTKSKHLRQGNGVSGTIDVHLHQPQKSKSVREKFLEQGLQPTSISIRSRQKAANVSTSRPSQAPPYIPALRLVHFDLKGAPPKIAYFKALFPLIKQAGANGVLLEYEDTFPFWGPLSSVAAHNAYKKREIRHILELAKNHDLQVIPLVQTFGHLEFVLKLPEFQHLREVADIPQAVCPTNNGSLMLVKLIIDQVMALHPDAKWIHIGSDEVYQLGHCPRCSRYDHNSLFLAYVRKVAKHVRNKHRVVPVMWDDMLRHMTVAELEKYELGRLVEPMAWTYVEDVYLFLPDSLWEKYSQVFPSMWTASAYKGAFGETLTVPDAKRHLENNRAWLTVMSEKNSSFQGFRGLALTGWQRYDHFAALCELLPAAVPSLVLNLLAVSKGGFDRDVFPRMQELLECSSRIHYHLDLEHDPFMWRALGVCFFPGSPVFRLTLRHHDVTKSLDKYMDDITRHKGWMTNYNINHNFSSPLRVNELLRDFAYYNSSLQMLQDAAVKALREVYDDETVSEWIELNISPYVKKMQSIWNDGLKLKKYKTWPRRPLPKLVELPVPPSIDFGFVKS